MNSKSNSLHLNWFLKVLFFTFIYFGAARLSLLLAFENTSASPIWPPSGIAFAFILFCGYRYWPAITIGAFFANAVVFLLNQASSSVLSILGISLIIAIGNTLEALLGVCLFRHALGERNPLKKPVDIFRFLLIVPAACLFASVIGAVSLCLFNFISWNYYLLVWFTWWLGDVVGILALSTLFLPWYKSRPRRLTLRQSLEAVFYLFITFFVGALVFGGTTQTSIDNYPLAYLFIPLLVLAVFRLGEYGLGGMVLMVLGTTIWGTMHGYGPFIKGALNESLLLLEGFLGVVAITGLVLMAALHEAQEVQKAVADREKWFRALIENSQDLLTLIDERGKILYSSPSTTRILGYDLEYYVNRNIFDFIHPDDLESITQHFHYLLEKEENLVSAESRFRHQNGSWLWLEGSGVNLLQEKNIGAIVINCRDVTERKQFELLQARLAAIVSSSHDAIISKTLGGVVTSWNKGAEALYGYTAEEMIGQFITKIIPPEKSEEFKKFMERLKCGENIENLETVRRHKNGALIDVSLTISVLREKGGQIIGASTIARDVTERKRAEERRQYIVEAALDAVISIDEEGRIIEWNRQAEEIFGWPREEVFGKTLTETIIPPAYRQAHQDGLKRYFQTGEGRVLNNRTEITGLDRGGREFPVELSIVPIHLKDGTIFSGFLRDITERKEAEKQLTQYAKDLKASNEDLESFAFVASHDLQEPLRIVSSYVQLLAKRYKEKIDPAATKYIGYIVDNVSRMQDMISGLLEYSRIGQQGKKNCEINSAKACDLAIANLDYVIKEKKARIIRDELPQVWGSETELIRLFQNLIGNSLKYCKKMPEIRISVVGEKDCWLFSVKDNGIGIDASYLDQVFDVFKRLHSKSEYPGTGMGLSICKKIVERFSGKIWAESKPDEGSVFYFTLAKIKTNRKK